MNYFMFVYTFNITSNTWITYILFTSIFYYLIFKSKLFNHHYLSIVIILLAGLIIDLVQNNFVKDLKNNIIGFIFSFVRVILLSLVYAIIKYTMERKFVSPYEIGVYNGLINLILFIISAIIDHYFIKANNYVEYFYNFNSTEVLVILGLMATQLGLYICCFLIDKSFTPCHIFIVFIFGQLTYTFKEAENYLVVSIICFIFILFFALVFNSTIFCFSFFSSFSSSPFSELISSIFNVSILVIFYSSIIALSIIFLLVLYDNPQKLSSIIFLNTNAKNNIKIKQIIETTK